MISWLFKIQKIISTSEQVLTIGSSAILVILSIGGFSVYLSYMIQHAETRKRILNLLNAHLAVILMLNSVSTFILQIKDVLDVNDNIFFFIIIQTRLYLSLAQLWVLSSIAVVTVLKKVREAFKKSQKSKLKNIILQPKNLSKIFS